MGWGWDWDVGCGMWNVVGVSMDYGPWTMASRSWTLIAARESQAGLKWNAVTVSIHAATVRAFKRRVAEHTSCRLLLILKFQVKKLKTVVEKFFGV
jgi:hypothetical protein